MGLSYRRDLFDRWDVDVPATWDEYRAAAMQTKKRGGGSVISAFPPANAQWFAAFPWQRGAHRVSTEGDTWGVLIPSVVSPFGVYLCRIRSESAVPDSVPAAARVDGAGEGWIFGGAIVSVIPLAVAMLVLQRFWRTGLTERSVEE